MLISYLFRINTMGIKATTAFMQAYTQSQIKVPLFQDKNRGMQPLNFEDSLSPIPNYPFCTLGVLTASGK